MAKTSITAKLGLDTTAFQRGLAKSQKSVSNFVKNGIRQFGALAGAAGLGAMAKAAIDLGSKISDMAVQLNIGTTELQTLEFAAREAGVEVSVMERALRNVQLRTQEAINGNKSYSKAFERLGIDINKFNQLPTEQKLERIARAQANAKDQAAAYNDVAIILGQRAGPAMQEILQNLSGPQGFKGLSDAAKESGEVMSEETIAKMDLAADRIESFKRKMTVLSSEVIAKVVPAFSLFWQGLGTTSDAVAMLTSKFLSFLGFLNRSVSATLEPIVKQFESLKMSIEGVMLGLKREFKAADKAFKKSADLQKESWEALKNIPSQLAEEAKRANREMEMDNKAFDESTNRRREKAKKAWADMWGDNVNETEKSMKKIDKATGAGKAGATTATTGKTSVVVAPVSTAAATPERRRKFGESLTRYDPTTGEERKFGESFSRSDSTNRQQRLKDVMANLAAKNASGQKKESAESATIKSAEHLEVIKDELTSKKS